MSELDLDYFISLIEQRPVIWDVNNSDYKNKFIKHDAWKSVCESLFPNFQEKENSERTELGNEVIKRWKGMKDSFNKYEKKLKDASRTGTGPKIKEYHLYKQLLFLKGNFPNDNTGPETEIEQTIQTPPENIEKLPRPCKKLLKKKMANECEDEIVRILKEPYNKHICFFKGILPSVEKLDENKTLLFQSRILQVLTELLYPNSSYQNNYQTQHLATPHRGGRKQRSNGMENSSYSSYRVPSPVQDSHDYGESCKRTDKLPEAKDIISNVYSYLYTEYNNLKYFTETSPDLTPLANILKRTASATGVSEDTVSAILENKKHAADCERDADVKRVKLTHEYEDGNVRSNKSLLANILKSTTSTAGVNINEQNKRTAGSEQDVDVKYSKLAHDAEDGNVSATDEESNCGIDFLSRSDDVEPGDDDRQGREVLPFLKVEIEDQEERTASAVQHLLSNIEVKTEPPEIKKEPADEDDPQFRSDILITTSDTSLVCIKTEADETALT